MAEFGGKCRKARLGVLVLRCPQLVEVCLYHSGFSVLNLVMTRVCLMVKRPFETYISHAILLSDSWKERRAVSEINRRATSEINRRAVSEINRRAMSEIKSGAANEIS